VVIQNNLNAANSENKLRANVLVNLKSPSTLGRINSTGGVIICNDSLTIKSSSMFNDGTIYSAGDLTVDGHVWLRNSYLLSEKDLIINSDNGLSMTNSVVSMDNFIINSEHRFNTLSMGGSGVISVRGDFKVENPLSLTVVATILVQVVGDFFYPDSGYLWFARLFPGSGYVQRCSERYSLSLDDAFCNTNRRHCTFRECGSHAFPQFSCGAWLRCEPLNGLCGRRDEHGNCLCNSDAGCFSSCLRCVMCSDCSRKIIFGQIANIGNVSIADFVDETLMPNLEKFGGTFVATVLDSFPWHTSDDPFYLTWKDSVPWEQNHQYNIKYDAPFGTYIYGQAVCSVKDMKFRNSIIADMGCGPVAIYNALLALGQPKFLSDIIYELELNPFMSGTTGTKLSGTYKYLSHHGFNHQMTFNVNTFASWARDSNDVPMEGRIFIIHYEYDKNCTSGEGHIIMLKSDANGTYTTYNQSVFWEEEMSEVDLFNHILTGDRKFIAGFYITS
jgi:hypothetical protein